MPNEHDATSEPPAPMGAREVGDTPQTVPGAMPENVGHDPADTHRTLTAAEQRNRDVVAFLNRLLMVVQNNVQTLTDLRNGELDQATRARLNEFVEEDQRAAEVVERAIRDLHGTVNPLRRTGGAISARARSLFEDLSQRTRRAVEARDVNTMRESPPFHRPYEYMDAFLGEVAAATHWDALQGLADAMDHQGLKDAVNECRDSARAHSDYLREKVPQVARHALHEANVAQTP